MGLRTKILAGFLILTMMLAVAGIWSIYELTTVGTSVQRLLDDNYKSINAGKTMIEALERDDSGVLLLLSGKWEQGRAIIESADNLFQQGFKIAQSNVTIPGESTYVDAIDSRYKVYKDLWIKPIVDTSKEGNLSWYFQEVHQGFLNVKLSVEKLIALNDQTMYQTATDLKNRAHRAIMPGIVAILAALVFTVIFNFLINYYVVSPIIRTTKGIQKFMETGEPLRVDVETEDELLHLVASIQRLVAQVRSTEE
jgi:predicted PurR-regulated permease PerM